MKIKMIVVVTVAALILTGLVCSHFVKPNVANAKSGLAWEELDVKKGPDVRRLPVPGGWLVLVTDGTGNGVTYMPDPGYKWR